LSLLVGTRIAELDLHQESVELGLGQRESADLMRRVAGADDEEWRRQRVSCAIRRDLPFLHRFEQRALRLRRRAVDLVREHELREQRAFMELEAARLAVEN